MSGVERVEGAGVELAYEEHGAGVPVVLVHGTALTRLSWREVAGELARDMRVIAYDRRGYGESGAPEPYTGTTIEEQAEDAAALVDALDASPALLGGHSAGALVALDLLIRRPELVRAAVLIEPPVFALSIHGAEALGAMRERIEEAARSGGPAAAVEAFLTADEGEELLERLGPERAEAIRASARAAFADFGAANGWEFTRRRLRAIELPVAVVRGTRSGPVWREVAAELAGLIGSAELLELESGHIPQLERPRELAAIVRGLAA